MSIYVGDVIAVQGTKIVLRIVDEGRQGFVRNTAESALSF
jgi:hypothetical protein